MVFVVLSYAFQISGAIILLNWTVSNFDDRVKRRFFQPHKGLILSGPEDDMKITLEKEELQRTAIEVLKGGTAAANIMIGYVFAIFMETTITSKWVVVLAVLLCAGAILSAEHFLLKCIAKRKYPQDIQLSGTETPEGTAAFRRVGD